MMLYVFHVDVGRMLRFDMTVALSSVENLKETIQRLHGIPAANIVLLVSGGVMLTQSTQVSYYSAGTDTNPIYMFLTGDERLPPTIATCDADAELRRQVEESSKLPAVIETVRQRAQLAQQMRELARKEESLCEQLVHEQHLQQQGWSAVVANMEDLTNEFRERVQTFYIAFDRHLQKRESYFELLRHFADDLKKLARIPILPGLMALAEADFHGFDELLKNDEDFSRSQLQQASVLKVKATNPAAAEQPTVTITDTAPALTASSGSLGAEVEKSSTSPNKKQKMGDEALETSTETQRRNLYLMNWITSKSDYSVLQMMAQECVQGLEAFNEDIYEKLKQELQSIINVASVGHVKEIKGLSERLCKLEEFKYKIKNMVREQKEQATALQHNETRALNLRDDSVLPDLCVSHKSQLQVMLENHIKIREYCRCISNSKDELGNNLHTRLKRIVYIENNMSEFDNRLLFYHRCLRRAERHITIIEQIHRAPSIYVAAVTEVVRRKIFSDEFRLWASRLAVDFDNIHSEEIRRRQEFNAIFEGHFLNILFPGMGDMPPAFANEHPLNFDTRLPNLTKSDIDVLITQLPELMPDVQLPDMEPVINFFISRSGDPQRERLKSIVVEPLQHQRLLELQAAAAVSGCEESETDTETEFEKVTEDATPSGQVAAEATMTAAAAETISVGTSMDSLTERIARSTITDHLLMLSASTLTEETESSRRLELERMRTPLEAMSKLARECLGMARSNLSSFRSDTLALSDDMKSELEMLYDKMNLLSMQSEERERLAANRCLQLQTQLKDREQKLKLAEQDKLAAVAAAREELIHEHKTEIESLRCRFKLMTSMERSPSDTSLEKLERPTSSASGISGGAEVEQLLQQQRMELDAQRERDISNAVEAERLVWQSRTLPLHSESVIAAMLEEKDRQLDLLREQNKLLTEETFQLKTRVALLTNEEGGNSWLKEKISYLNRDKDRLEEELNEERSKRQEMQSSVAALISHRYIALQGCGKGDIVFAVWSMRHHQFMIVQDSSTLYFVHGDSLPSLQLNLPAASAPADGGAGGSGAAAASEVSQVPLPFYAIGRIVDKEFCQARKGENRYHVARGTKFYRIKLAPLPTRTPARRDRLESIGRSVSDMSSQTMALAAAQSTSAARDTLDGAAAVLAGTSGSGSSVNSSVFQSFKERTVSITSANEEDEESASLLSERCRYISVSEEDELQVAAAQQQQQLLQLQQQQQQKPQQQSVITEQPTATSKLKLDLLLASADIVVPQTQTLEEGEGVKQQQQEDVEVETESAQIVATLNTNLNTNTTTTATTTTIITPTTTDTLTSTSTSTTITTTTDPNANPTTIATTTNQLATTGMTTSSKRQLQQQQQHQQSNAMTTMNVNIDIVEPMLSTAPMLPMSIGTTISEDSDEYRSLEGKDETDFPISE